MSEALFRHAVIVGLGLIGSSLARDLHALGLAKRITGIDPAENSRHLLLAAGILDEAFAIPAVTGEKADLMLIATPPSSWPHLSQTLPALCGEKALVMDVGSVKRMAAELFTPAFLGHGHFIPAHPIAGSEKSGASAGRQGLFDEKRVILCPAEGGPEWPLRLAHAFWQALGAIPEMMPADAHDRIYACVSHLPQMIAYSSVKALGPQLPHPLPDRLKPFFRLAGSSPALWSDIALANAGPLGQAMEQFLHLIAHIGAELRAGDEQSADGAKDAGNDAVLDLLPRIIAAGLVGSVSLAEKQQKLKMARYAGSGFADVASPASQPPEGDIERISQSYAAVATALRGFEAEFRLLLLLIREQNRNGLFAYMEEAQTAHRSLNGESAFP